MLTASARRKILLFLLAAVLAAPWVSAAPRTEGPVPAVEPSLLERLDRFWSFLWNAWSKEGCRIDPDGRCSTGTAEPATQTETGCRIDPDGRCLP
jgi:hypothetical protein